MFAFLHHCSLYVSSGAAVVPTVGPTGNSTFSIMSLHLISGCPCVPGALIAIVSTPQDTMATQRLPPCGPQVEIQSPDLTLSLQSTVLSSSHTINSGSLN